MIKNTIGRSAKVLCKIAYSAIIGGRESGDKAYGPKERKKC